MRTISLLVLLAVVLLTPRPALATAQQHERILVNGRVLSMQATPLAPLLASRDDLKEVFQWESSANWRGYVAQWAVEGDRLYLLAIEREVYADRASTWRSIPLSTILGKVEAPVAATWFTGTLRLPLSSRGRYVHMGFATQHWRELRLTVDRGLVRKQEVVNAVWEARGRSESDLAWCALPSARQGEYSAGSDGWLDARALTTKALQGSVPRGEPFRTRGLLDRDDGEPWTLWIPATLVTPEARIPLRGIETLRSERTWPHVELEGSWPAGDALVGLDVSWIRMLEPGETIHHPAFPLPDVPLEKLKDDELDSLDAQPVDLASAQDVQQCFGLYDLVTLHGLLEVARDGTTTVLGVDVRADPAWRGQAVVATGGLERWEISERLLRLGPVDVAPFKQRGAGTYHRLVNAASGLAVAEKDAVAAPEAGGPAPK